MRLRDGILPALALAAAGLLFARAEVAAFNVTGDVLDLTQRDFRIHANFGDASANDNQVPDPDFPGASGAELAIWKGVAEWGSGLHGTGATDPTQSDGIGSGGANFDSTYQGLNSFPGGPNGNIISELQAFGGGTLAFTELPTSDGWRIRFYADPTIWHDGPGPVVGGPDDWDLQGIAAHEYGHALGLAHTAVAFATMDTSSNDQGVDLRSLEPDDMAGIQSIYGVKSLAKPRIDTYTLGPGGVTLLGENFDATGNEVWFTDAAGGGGTPLVVSGVAATQGGTRIDLGVPANAGQGEVLVRVPGAAASALSNAFPFDPNADPCTGPVLYGTAQMTSAGSLPELFWNGLPSAGMGSFRIGTDGGTQSGMGILFSGPTMQAAPFGGGTLYVGGRFVREQMFSFSAGSVLLDVSVDAGMVGGTRYYQIWYADAGLPGGFGLSNGLAVTFCQ